MNDALCSDNAAVDASEAREALTRKYGNAGVIVLPLKSGRFAIFDRSYTIRSILPEPPSAEELRGLSSTFNANLTSRTLEARFYGEPDDKTWKRDQRRARQQNSHQQNSHIHLREVIDL